MLEQKIENEVIRVIEQICSKLKIDADITPEFRPGNYIMSQVLLTFISEIETAIDIVIPNNCYIFSDGNQQQLSIKEATQKILNVKSKKKNNV